MFTLRFNTLDCGSESTLVVQAAKICSPSSSLIHHTQQAGPCLGPKGSVFPSLGKIIHEEVMIFTFRFRFEWRDVTVQFCWEDFKVRTIAYEDAWRRRMVWKKLSRKQPVQPSCWHGLAWASWKRKRKAKEIICRLDSVPIWQAQHPPFHQMEVIKYYLAHCPYSVCVCVLWLQDYCHFVDGATSLI